MSEETRGYEKPTVLQIIASVLAAGFGVQSTANRERDFTTGSAKSFVVVGIIATILFVLTILFVVNLVLKFTS
jgi:hypothetical protein